MTKKIFFAVLFCCGFILAGYSQVDMEEVVYLKNGGVTRGEILEIIPGEKVKIKTVDRNIFVYNLVEVLKITKEPSFGKKEYLTISVSMTNGQIVYPSGETKKTGQSIAFRNMDTEINKLLNEFAKENWTLKSNITTPSNVLFILERNIQ